MGSKPLVPRDQIVGVFRGFSEGGMEFHADLALPYRADYHQRPLHGQFLLIELDGENEAVLGRITSLRSEGRLVSPEGEDYLFRQAREGQPAPEDIREQYLKFKVNVRVLGVLRKNADGSFVFVASHRRIPHVGSPVVFPSEEVLREIANHNADGAALGVLAMGEFVWAGAEGEREVPISLKSWMRIESPQVVVRFAVENLIARRSFIFARAGYGKSNLVKLLFSELYRTTPTSLRRGGVRAPVGTIIFDRDGEYFWPDHQGRPGLCDVVHLQDKLVVFTSRQAPSAFYGSFVAGPVKLDIRRLPAATVVGIALSPERQDQQNVRKLKGLPQDKWKELVDLVYQQGNNADLARVKELLSLDAGGDVEAVAARSNVNTIVRMLHDPHSRLLDHLTWALEAGKLCVVDLSLLSGEAALVLSGLILQHLFDRNQEHFTRADARTIPVIAVLEEAQSVLGHGASSGHTPYVTWVKEGRKYDLGAVMITQQPGSIPEELLSQGDNWFIFHLLSAGDLKAVQKANAHFSEDLLSSLLNEPIPGHCVFWSGVSGKPYPLPVRVLSFEERYQAQDPTYTRGQVDTFVRELKRRSALGPGHAVDVPEAEQAPDGDLKPGGEPDYYTAAEEKALRALEDDPEFLELLGKWGARQLLWRRVVDILERLLPEGFSDRRDVANSLLPKAFSRLFGPQGQAWNSERTEHGWVIRIHPTALADFLERHGRRN